jgi:hypothetical protein
MKRAVWIGILGLAGMVPASAAPRDAKEELLAAVKKVAEAASYAWTSTPQQDAAGGQGNRFRGAGPSEGKAEKDGLVWISAKFGENAVEGVVKGEKAAVKGAEGWTAVAPRGQGGQQGRRDPSMMFGAMLRNFKAPAAQAEALANGLKEVKVEEGVYSGELTEEAAKSLLSFGGRPGGGGQGLTIEGAGGSAKFWTAEGALSKYEVKLTGKMKFGDREIEINRTTTVEIKELGTAKLEVPEEAKAKLQ